MGSDFLSNNSLQLLVFLFFNTFFGKKQLALVLSDAQCTIALYDVPCHQITSLRSNPNANWLLISIFNGNRSIFMESESLDWYCECYLLLNWIPEMRQNGMSNVIINTQNAIQMYMYNMKLIFIGNICLTPNQCNELLQRIRNFKSSQNTWN